MLEERDRLPPELRARVQEVGNLCILAGCTAEEVIAACRQTVEQWFKTRGGR